MTIEEKARKGKRNYRIVEMKNGGYAICEVYYNNKGRPHKMSDPILFGTFETPMEAWEEIDLINKSTINDVVNKERITEKQICG